MGLDVDAAAALRVVCAAEAGDVHHAALVDVHHAGCGDRRRVRGSGWSRLDPSCSPPSLRSWRRPASRARPARVSSEGLLQLSCGPRPPPQALMDKGGGTCPSSRKAEAPRAPPTALKPEAPSSVARAAGNAAREAAGVAGPDRPGSAVSPLRSSHAGCMPRIAEIAPFFKIKQES